MAKTKRMTRAAYREGFRKLPAKDRMTIIGIFAFLLVAGIVLLLSAFVRGGGLNVVGEYPDSNLAPVSDVQNTVVASYNELPILIQFPGTSYAVSVGGQQVAADDYGTSFYYSSDTYLIACRQTTSVSLKEAVEQKYASYLKAGDTGKYSKKKDGKGYLNGLFFTYEAGSFESGGKTFYLLNYVYDTAEGYRFIFSAATPQFTALQSDRNLLNKVLYTFCQVSADKNDSNTAGTSNSDTGK